MTNEIMRCVDDDNYDDFQHIKIMFLQNFISLSSELFNDETDLTVRFKPINSPYKIKVVRGSF
jgi:hypothetical protein